MMSILPELDLIKLWKSFLERKQFTLINWRMPHRMGAIGCLSSISRRERDNSHLSCVIFFVFFSFSSHFILLGVKSETIKGNINIKSRRQHSIYLTNRVRNVWQITALHVNQTCVANWGLFLFPHSRSTGGFQLKQISIVSNEYIYWSIINKKQRQPKKKNSKISPKRLIKALRNISMEQRLLLAPQLLHEPTGFFQRQHWTRWLDRLCRWQYGHCHRARRASRNLKSPSIWVDCFGRESRQNNKSPFTTSPSRVSCWLFWSPVMASWILYAKAYCGNGS